MKLVISRTSPYARKTLITRLEKGLEDRIDLVASSFKLPGAQAVIRNPLGKVPCLILDDGTLVYDSPVICEFLDGLGGQPTLFPVEFERRMAAIQAQALGDGVMDAAFSIVMENKRDDADPSAFWLQRWEAAILRGLDAMEMSGPSVDASVTIGDVSYYSALSYLDLRLDRLNWRDRRPALSDWFDAISGRPSFAATHYQA